MWGGSISSGALGAVGITWVGWESGKVEEALPNPGSGLHPISPADAPMRQVLSD